MECIGVSEGEGVGGAFKYHLLKSGSFLDTSQNILNTVYLTLVDVSVVGVRASPFRKIIGCTNAVSRIMRKPDFCIQRRRSAVQ